MRSPARRYPLLSPARALAAQLALIATTAALLAVTVGCQTLEALGDLSGLGSNDQPIECTITGALVGEDGKAIERMDVAWYPEDRLSQSAELFSGSSEGNRFTITQLVVATGSTQIRGELGFNERAVPPNPQRYKQIRVEIDLPADGCNKDLGDITLPGR